MDINWKAFYEEEANFKRFTLEKDPIEILRVKMVMSLIPKKNISSILDVGCGDGYLCHLLKQRGYKKVVGVDLSEGRVKYARSRFQEAVFEQAEIYNLPFKDNSFQLITAVEVLEHLDNPMLALNEVKRVSSKYLLITVPNNQRLKEMVCPYCMKRFFPNGHIQSFNKDGISSLCKENNLKVRKLRVYKPIEKYWFIRMFMPILRCVFADWFKRGGAIGCLLEKYNLDQE